MRKINFYTSVSGKQPVREFLDQLNEKQVSKVLWTLKFIREHEKIPGQYFKKLVNTDGLWEIRVSQGSNIFRLLCFFDGDEIIILTNGFQKKTQKTPKQEINLAEKRKREHLARKNNGRSG